MRRTLGLNPNETKSLAQALEAWLGEVLTCLACREIHDDGVWSICHFLALEDANTVHIISADEIWRLTLEERLANAERRVNALEKEKSDLEADALCLRQERTHANRAALSANRERSISHAQRPQATPDHAHFLSTGDDLEARCVALGAERDELKRKADRLAMRHADVLLRIGPFLLFLCVAVPSCTTLRTGGQQLESSAAAKAAALEGSQKSVPSRMPPAATKLPPRTPASECLCFGSCLAGPGSC